MKSEKDKYYVLVASAGTNLDYDIVMIKSTGREFIFLYEMSVDIFKYK